MKWEPPKRPIVPRISIPPHQEASRGFVDASMNLPKPRNSSADVSGQTTPITPIRDALRGVLRVIARPTRSRHASSDLGSSGSSVDTGSPARAFDDERMTEKGAHERWLSRLRRQGFDNECIGALPSYQQYLYFTDNSENQASELEAIPARAPIELPVEDGLQGRPASAPSHVDISEYYGVPKMRSRDPAAPEPWRRG